MDELKSIPDYEGLYWISRSGDITNRNGLTLKLRKDLNGYVCITLSKNNKCKFITVHRLVGKLFVPNVHGYPDINHIDGDKNNNDASNLEWCTKSHNMRHAWQLGLIRHNPNKQSPVKNRGCSIESCVLPHAARGYCYKHYRKIIRRARLALKAQNK